MKISITANGVVYKVEENCSLEAFLQDLDLSLKQVIVEYNGEAKTRSQAAGIRLADNDVMEIVRIVAGG
jgi:thiamine biosynthesis protein ThiS